MPLNDREVPELSLIESSGRQQMGRRRCCCSPLLIYFLFSLGGLVALGVFFGSKLYSKHTGAAVEEGAAAARGPGGAPPNAHLTASSNISVSSTYLPWEYEKGDAYLYLFSYDKKRHALIVPQMGRYFIYLQVTYRMPSNLDCSQSKLSLLRAVYVWSDSYRTDRILMRAKDHTRCSHQSWVKTVSSTGVYSLESGDRLMVEASRRDLLEIDEKSLYFGAFLISRGTDA